MIKKGLLTFALVVIMATMAIGFMPAQRVYAQGGLTWTSSYQVYNPGASTANVTYYYYNQGDGSLAVSVPDAIPSHGSKTYFPITGVPAGFNGSLVISSDLPLATTTDLMTPDFHFAAATMGFSAGNTSFGIPLVGCNNNGFNSFFVIQNAGSADATVTVTYIPGGFGNTGQSDVVTIKPGASKTLDQAVASTTGTKTCTQLADSTSHKFVGAASLSSTQPIVASGYWMNTTSYQALSGFNGFSSGSTTVVAPIIMANNSNYWSSIQVQNVGTTATNVTIAYGANTVSGGYVPIPDSCTALAAGQSCTVLQSGGQWLPTSRKYIGNATITSSGQPIVVVVNTVNLSGAANSRMDAYDGFDPSAATANLDMPLIMANNSGWNTTFTVMNVGTGACTNVTATYSANTGGSFAPTPESFSLAVGANKTIFQASNPPSNGSTVNNWIGVGKYIGSVSMTGTGTGCAIVGTVNQLGSAGYDKFMTYGAFNR